MQFHALILLFSATGALAAPRILGCLAGTGKCCTNGPEGEAVTEARFVSGCNDNGGGVGPNEVFGGC
ncbi:hypothetical protein J7T55_000762 [Diaporthe amygdali]|uniref:uncharacterized protein n=1 Tax=Phomopsis amygdali TaxID=1214568 RepID=UPI0022FED4CF|nr:uncharacterized protein J7T55_000762 [Diaporthe amygdali]KAJ0119912.1 hypothetical protein J7T55_000762 [Diaporthe amygdali]